MRKICSIVVLRENGLSHAAIAREIGRNMTTSVLRKFCLRYQGKPSLQNKEGKRQKTFRAAVDDRNKTNLAQ